MKIVCLSASNISPARQHSASTRTCDLIRDLLVVRNPPIEHDWQAIRQRIQPLVENVLAAI